MAKNNNQNPRPSDRPTPQPKTRGFELPKRPTAPKTNPNHNSNNKS